MTSQECIQRKTDTDTEIALGFILTELRKGKWRIIIVDALLPHKLVWNSLMLLQTSEIMSSVNVLATEVCTGAIGSPYLNAITR